MDNNQDKRDVNLSANQEEISEPLFFSGAHRRKLLEEVKKGIFAGVTVITITGDDGSGKTTTCRMVEKELPEEYICVYLPETLESFDDVLRILARRVGIDNLEDYGTSQDLVTEITDHLQGGGSRIVVVFDQAELMYLATLERIRKMLDKINKPEVLFQIILTGRSSLLDNLKRLSICNFNDIEERHFTLSSLGLSETYAYLNHFARQLSKVGGKNVFSPEAAKKIFTLAQGSFAQTNIMAEKALQSYDPETSPMVFIENVDEDGGEVLTKSKKNNKGIWHFDGRKMIGGALVLIILVGGSLYFSGEDENVDPLVSGAQNGSERVAKVPGDRVGERGKDTGSIISTSSTKNKKTIEDKIPSVERNKEQKSSAGPKVIAEDVVSEKEVHDTVDAIKHDNSKMARAEKETVASTEKEEDTEVANSTLLKAETTAEEEKKKMDDGETEVVTPSKPETNQEQFLQVKKVETSEQQLGPDTPAKTEDTEPQIKELVIAEEQKEEAAREKIVVTEIDSVPQDQGTEIVESASEQGEKTTIKIRSEAVEVVEVPARTGEEENVAADSTPVKESSSPGILEITTGDESEGESITLSGKNKRKPLVQTTEAEGKKLVKIAPAKIEVPLTSAAEGNLEQEDTKIFSELYQQRVTAADQWLSGEKNNLYTVQLMKLTSEQAEENLKQRLEQEEYRNIADRLYIIKNSGASSVFVYYGEFADHDSARKVRNTLPIFLRKHNPYTISVENAVKKATSP